MKPLITVALSTYNGERYLEKQLESLWDQTFQDFELVVRDDGSSDNTVEILRRVARERTERIRLIVDNEVRLGPRASFARLLSHTDASYVAFCDQDDYWMPRKLARLHQAIASEEALYGSTTPVLCSSDAAVTDAELRITEPSFFARHGISISDGRDLELPRLLFRNYAIGAATMINAALAVRCQSMPDSAIMHDWWCALVATVTGRTVVLPEALMLYRQHEANAIGSKRSKVPKNVTETCERLTLARKAVAMCVRQAHHLRVEFSQEINSRDRTLLNSFETFASQNALQRAITVIKARGLTSDFVSSCVHLFACMTAPALENGSQK